MSGLRFGVSAQVQLHHQYFLLATDGRRLDKYGYKKFSPNMIPRFGDTMKRTSDIIGYARLDTQGSQPLTRISLARKIG